MASHGGLRIQARPRTDEDRQRELRKIEQYKYLESQVQAAANASDLSESALRLTSKLLKENPEYYTIWNYRRRILQNLFAEDLVKVAGLLQSDIEFLFPLLRIFPKCYWTWNHRRWLLAQASARLSIDQATQFWQEELNLVAKMLGRDNRNFHAWDYRRRVTTELQRLRSTKSLDAAHARGEETQDWKCRQGYDNPKAMCEDEFTYTTKMVRGNLSNFSAWHQRSILIPQVLHARNASPADRRKMFDSELKLSKDAAFLDPWDQSLWFYYHHLMHILTMPITGDHTDASSVTLRHNRGQWVYFTNHDIESYLVNELNEVKELLEDPSVTDCKWIYESLLIHAEAYLRIEAGNQLQSISTQNLRSWLSKLNQLDPLRRGRWDDWASRVGL